MAKPVLQPGETVLARAGVQLARGFPQTAGDLFLTDRRLVLRPDQFMSAGFGKLLEVPLERVREVKAHGRFQGGTAVGGPGRKLEVVLDDGTRFTFSFFLNADPDAFHAALERCRLHELSVPSEAPSELGTERPFPKPRRTIWYWLLVVLVAGVAADVAFDWIRFVFRK